MYIKTKIYRVKDKNTYVQKYFLFYCLPMITYCFHNVFVQLLIIILKLQRITDDNRKSLHKQIYLKY